jgi:hypothetical protein
MPPVGFGPTIPARARPQTYALDRVATGIDVDIVVDKFIDEPLCTVCVCVCVCVIIRIQISKIFCHWALSKGSTRLSASLS